ncbi:Glycosyltransferase LARGE2 [Micractinium conductrix]|uniref:Glycosyltransferase LARGE2 n=1 Tax=Micractinium conductrix TaxID=554055 RepID=A0A2P6VCI3_9CHLO|nr:Glycosyltransferase LARGE2 [Micractinium conductrix]|eukprot:PSC71803.1 Glycosyltransferase LARGE2 [Micractinium conductrix]
MLSLLAPLISFTGGGTTGHYGGGVVPLNSAGFSGPLAARIDGSVIDSLQLVEAVANKMALIPGSVFQTYATVMQRMWATAPRQLPQLHRSRPLPPTAGLRQRRDCLAPAILMCLISAAAATWQAAAASDGGDVAGMEGEQGGAAAAAQAAAASDGGDVAGMEGEQGGAAAAAQASSHTLQPQESFATEDEFQAYLAELVKLAATADMSEQDHFLAAYGAAEGKGRPPNDVIRAREGYDAQFVGMLESPADGIGVWRAASGAMTVVCQPGNLNFAPFAKLCAGEYGSAVLDPGHALLAVNPSWTRSADIGQLWDRKLKAAAAALIDTPGTWQQLYCLQDVRTSQAIPLARLAAFIMHKVKLSRFAPKRPKARCSSSEDDEEASGSIAAFHGGPPATPSRTARSAAACAAVALSLLLMVAVVGVLRRRQLTALLAPRAATPAAVALLASRGGGGGSFTDFSQAYRGAAEHPEQYHHVPLDDGPHERACSPTAAQQAERMRAQTALLIEAGDYRPRVGEPAARCRSDAAPAAPLPHLRSAAVLFSRKRRPPAGVTVVTQLSLERLAMLERQCRSWSHPLAAAVYVPLLHGRVASADSAALDGSSLDAALLPLLRLHAQMEADADACQMDLEVVTEARCSAEEAALQPTNAARNRAMRLVATEARHRRAVLKFLQQPVALILPAFQTAGRRDTDAEQAVETASSGKQAVLAQLDARTLVPFHSGLFSKGHASTDYRRWAFASNAFEVGFTMGFEPYILVHRKHVPPYDERFRGYFINKLIQRAHMDALGTRWLVHPGKSAGQGD